MGSQQMLAVIVGSNRGIGLQVSHSIVKWHVPSKTGAFVGICSHVMYSQLHQAWH